MGRGGLLLLAVRGCLVLLLTGGSLISPAQVRVGRGGLLLLPVCGRLVHLSGQRQPSSVSVSPRTRVRGTRRHFFSGRPLAAWPICVAGGETTPTRDDVMGDAAVYLLTVRNLPPRARARGARQSISMTVRGRSAPSAAATSSSRGGLLPSAIPIVMPRPIFCWPGPFF